MCRTTRKREAQAAFRQALSDSFEQFCIDFGCNSVGVPLCPSENRVVQMILRASAHSHGQPEKTAKIEIAVGCATYR
jgi:hypothetical protein